MRHDKFNTPEENAVIAAAAKGDKEAFEKLVIMYEGLVYNAIRLKINNYDDALDLSQEVFIKVWRSIGRYRFECSFSTWIYKITINACYDHLRREVHNKATEMPTYIDKDGDEIQVEFPDESISVSPERSTEQSETAEAVRRAMARLSPSQRQMVLLRDIEGYSYEEISEMLSLEIGTVKSRLNRARGHLKEMLSETYEGMEKI